MMLTWTKKKPKVEGWYWLRTPAPGWGFDSVVWVEEHRDGFVISPQGWDTEAVKTIDGYWAGPLPVPGDAIKKRKRRTP